MWKVIILIIMSTLVAFAYVNCSRSSALVQKQTVKLQRVMKAKSL